MDNQHVVKTECFEGPLDLLLSLIEKRKLEINNISLSSVAGSFIEYVKSHGRLPVSESAHFILIASTLVLIKSLSLIPTLTLTDEEQQSIEELEARLGMYKRIKTLSAHISKRFGKTAIFQGGSKVEMRPVFSPDASISLKSLSNSLSLLLLYLPKLERQHSAEIDKVLSLEEVIDNLMERVKENIETSFNKVSVINKRILNREERVRVIINFLALLELVKGEIVSVIQKSQFQDIAIRENDNI